MNEAPKGPKKPKGINTLSVTNWAIRTMGKGVAVVAKAGYEKYKSLEGKKFEEAAMNDIHEIMFGVLPTPGHPLPAMRATPLSPDEVKEFTAACNGLTARGIALPNHVRNFAGRFYIRLNP